MQEKVDFDYDEITQIIAGIFYDYKRNQDKSGEADIYPRISKEIIDKEVNTLVQYGKILISYNDNIISIKKF